GGLPGTFEDWELATGTENWKSKLCCLSRFCFVALGFALIQIQLDLLQQLREEFFFGKASLHICTAIHWAVAGHDDDWDLRVPGVNFARQLQTVHALHAEVGHQ